MTKASDKDKIKFSFGPFINQKEVTPEVDWTKVLEGPYPESDLEVILFQGFENVNITATEPVKVYLSQKNWDSNIGNSLFLTSFCLMFVYGLCYQTWRMR